MAYTQNDFLKHLKPGQVFDLNGKTYIYRYSTSTDVRLKLSADGETISGAYEDIVSVPLIDEFREQMATQHAIFSGAGGVVSKDDWETLNAGRGPLLCEVNDGSYVYGCAKQVRKIWLPTFQQYRTELDLSADELSDALYEALSPTLPLLASARRVKADDEQGFVVLNLVDAIYAVRVLESAKPAQVPVSPLPATPATPAMPAAESQEPGAAQDDRLPVAEVRRHTVEPFAVPYLMTTQPDGYLPDMTDFTLERAGSVDDGWYSVAPIKADRALTDGETLSAFLVNRRDGEIRRFDYVVPKESLAAAKWPVDFAKFIAKQSAAVTAGAWSKGSTFSTKTTPLRVWCHTKYRAFTNAPFAANLVQVLACNDAFTLSAGQTLCLQVRDLKTQTLFEQHFFPIAEAQAGIAWSKALCEQINRDSHLLRAGVMGKDSGVTPAAEGNAFWGPQCAELGVTLTLANWWESRKVEGKQALDAGTKLHAWVYDEFSSRLLAQHEWTPSTAQRASGKWLKAWANALNASDMSAYLRATVSSPTKDNLTVTAVDNLALWHRGDGLRIFTSLPDAQNWSAGPALELPQGSKTTDSLQVTVRHPFNGHVLHEAVFTPATEKGADLDQQAWDKALIVFLNAQSWPELQVQPASEGQESAGVRLPRFCELQVELDPVAAAEPKTTAALPTVTVASTTGSLRITVSQHTGELGFRLNRTAWNKGVRVVACVPVLLDGLSPDESTSDEDKRWPISVTADSVTWGALAKPMTYELSLDCPETMRGEEAQGVGHIGAFSETQFWQAPQQVSYSPPKALTPYKPMSRLCEDYGNTERSEIFDTLGQGESGVDARTGLFHAHYPVATLQGRNGLGPICDLTLHYSALRGNEAGLGDGWAWRFSSLDVRERCLTLANGIRIIFTSEEWQTLGEEKSLNKKHCWVKSNKDYSQFTLDLPSGRREVLSKPGVAGGDEDEPNAEFLAKIIGMLNAIKEKSKPKFPTFPTQWTQWVLWILSPGGYYIGGKLDYDEAVSAWEKHGSVKDLDTRIAKYERPFVQLLPSQIISRYGEALDLEWKRQKGQFLLTGIKSGEQALFTAEYVDTDATSTQVTMEVWPTSDEGYNVELKLQDCLLSTLTRTKAKADEKPAQIIQQVECGYADDPTLDRVLCRLTELDGSVECVQYSPGIVGNRKPVWPQAVLHALIPGDGQENQVNTYRYTGRLLNTSDQLYIIEGERGAHGAREHHLQVFGLDNKTQRQELLVGSASADSQWLEFKALQSLQTQVIRYTGYGDDLVKAIEQLKLGIKDDKVVVLQGERRVKYQTAIIDLLWAYSQRNRKRLIRAIESLLQVSPAEQRPALGKATDKLIIETNADGRPIKLVTSGQHTLYSAYYPAGGGDNIVTAATLNGLAGLVGVPQLSCPKVPDYAVPPLMVEYQCDEFGHALGLKLFGYRSVARGGRTFLELEQQVVIEGVGVKGEFDGTLTSSTPWAKTADSAEVLWRQRTTSVSPVTTKKTPSDESKVRQWTLTDKQLTHLGSNSFSLETTRVCEDNPTQSSIVVRTTSKTKAGSEAVSTERCSRYSQRCLARIEQSVETTYAYDAAGRVIDEATYRLKPGENKRADDQKTDAHTKTQYSVDGKLASQTHGNGDTSRAYLDGLQRVWRSEWCKAGATTGYLPLYECSLQGRDDSQVVGSWEWDFLPGGQAVVQMAQVQPQAGRQPWVTTQGLADVDASSVRETRLVASQNEQNIEVFYREIDGGYSDDAAKFIYSLVELSSFRGKNPSGKSSGYAASNLEVVKLLIRNAFYWGTLVFDQVSMSRISLLKFAQGLAGYRGDEGITDKFYEYNDLSEKGKDGKMETRRFYLDNDSLKAAPDMIDVEPWDFEAFLDPDAARKAQANLLFSRPAQTDIPETVQNIKTFSTEEQGLSQHSLSKRTTEFLTRTDGTFERTQTLSDGAGNQQLKLIQQLDSNARVVSSERVVGDETRTYAFERDALGRVTKITRPDSTLIEKTYHGFSDQITELKVGGKVVATQAMVNDSTLQSRKVGNRTYTFDDDSVTLPDKTRLQTKVDAKGVQWTASDNAVASLTREEDVTKVASGGSATDIWKHSFTRPSLPGRVKEAQTTPRSESHSVEWQSLRGTTVASLRGDGQWLRGFVDHEGRLLRTCKAHEDVAYRYDSLGRMQSRQVQALKAGEQWQVLSQHNGFGREVKRTFLHNGALRFEQQMTWRGDGRLASKASYQGGTLNATEQFSYDELDRLQRYDCAADDEAHCPKDADGKAVKAQVFSWDALDNLVSCVSARFDDSEVTRAYTYDESTDPTRMTAIKRGAESETLSWTDNGYLETAEAQGPKFAYNACGQLSKVTDANDQLLARYEYDGYQRLAAQYVKADDSTRELRYDGDELIGEIWFDKARAVTRHTSLSAGLAEYDGEQVRWLIDDPQVGVAGQVKGGELSLAPLLPFGEGAVLDEVVVGYNGMRRDRVTGHYHAGNGYRSYDPTLCRYAQPDWLAPVGEGGHNPYQHCPDPVNLHDPSGAIMLSRWGQDLEMQQLDEELQNTATMEVGGKWRGLALSLVLTVVGIAATVLSGGTASMLLFAALTALSVASFGLEVASVLTAESNSELSKRLGIALMVIGILSAACFMGTIKAGFSLLKQTISALGRTVRVIGRGVKAGWQVAKRFYSASRLGLARQSFGLSIRQGVSRFWPNARSATNTFMRKVDIGFFDASAASFERMPTYARQGWYGKLRSYWAGPDPLDLTGRPAKLYAWANQSRFVSKVNAIEGLAIEANILRGMGESSQALAQGDDSSTISVQARARLRRDTPYTPRDIAPRYDLWTALGLSG